MTSEGLQQDFRRMTPHIIENNVEPLGAGLADKGGGQLLIRQVERDGRVGAQIAQCR
jgi:hypothetical protein